ncbi:hypothetical protein AMR41_29185 [Hapalosiphon sp. MRB220]|nr:hypothetical protein AMR41_29185 [Hapalosiphon sp. MRB220]
MLIAPLVDASSQSSSAQSQTAKSTSMMTELASVSVEADARNISYQNQVSKLANIDSSVEKHQSLQVSVAAAEPQILIVDKVESWAVEGDSLSVIEIPENNSLAAVELAPAKVQPDSVSRGMSTSQISLVEKLKAAKLQSLEGDKIYLSMDQSDSPSPQAATIVTPQYKELPVVEQPDQAQQEQQDPIASPHPIPWNWIMTTHQTVSSKTGSGVRYYRSLPVVSPDGRYAAYSRVQLEVKPELYNSRVSSVLFLEDRQTKQLQVVSSTSRNMDTLINTKVSRDANGEGTIGVLVPISWSEKGDRFLARKFEAVFNTSDATDRAVIWDRQSDRTNTISPAYDEQEHEKIAVLLGWSKTQPNKILFRSGELGEEEWPVLAVANDGSTAIATDTDKAVTFGEKVKEVWPGPQVAYR